MCDAPQAPLDTRLAARVPTVSLRTLLLDTMPSVRCYEGVHQRFLTPAVVFTLLYVAGIPLAIVLVLYAYRSKLFSLPVYCQIGFLCVPHDPLPTHTHAVAPRPRHRLPASPIGLPCGTGGCLPALASLPLVSPMVCLPGRVALSCRYGRFQPTYRWWEVTTLLRKLGIVCSFVFISRNVDLQVMAALLVLLASLSAQSACKPFKQRSLNALELGCLLTGICTLIVGTAFTSRSRSGTAEILLSVLVMAALLANLLVIVAAVGYEAFMR